MLKITYRIGAFLLFATGLFFISSCEKDHDNTEYFARGGNDIIETPDGNILIAGYNSTSSGGYDAALILTDQSGNVAWSKTFGSSNTDDFTSVINTNDGGYLAAGFSNASASGDPRMYVVHTNAAGESVWAYNNYTSAPFSQAFKIIPVGDSGYMVAGSIRSTTTGDRDLYLLRLDNEGKKVWDKQFVSTSSISNDTINDDAYAVLAAADGGFYLTGSLNGYYNFGGKLFLMKVSASGDSLWTKLYCSGIGYSLAYASDGNILIGGSYQANSINQVAIIKTDSAGTKIWGSSYGGNEYGFGANLVASSDGGCVITGISTAAGSQDVYLLRVNASGNQVWTQTYGGDNADQGFGVALMSDGNLCVTGISNSDGSNIFLNKVSFTNGSQLWYKAIQ